MQESNHNLTPLSPGEGPGGEAIRTLVWVTLFAIAMGFLESSVVVYLRQLYYPEGFRFPMKMLEKSIAITELWRELATVIMLLGIGVIAGRSAASRFAWFIYSFAIWDIFYYVFLKALLNWPAGLNDWDILFLIPLPWVGPVWAPCIISLSMILLAGVILYYEQKGLPVRIKRREWLLLVAGSLTFIYSFIYDHLYTLINQGSGSFEFFMREYIPQHYPSSYFILAMALVLSAITSLVLRFRYEKRIIKLSGLKLS